MSDKSLKCQDKSQLLDLLSTNLPDMLWIKDVEGRYLFANETICKNLLMAEDTNEPIGKNDVYFALREREKHKDNPQWHTFGELCFNSDEVVIESNKAMRFEEYGNIKGKLTYLEVFKAPFYDDQGNILGTVGAGRDITEYKMLQQKLEHTIEQVDEISSIAHVGMWELQLPSFELTWSKEMYELYGVDQTHFTPTLENVLSFDKKYTPSRVKRLVTLFSKSEELKEVEYSIVRNDGKRMDFLVRLKAVKNDEGKVHKIVGTFFDITKQQRFLHIIEQQREAFEYQATHDRLTSLPNRAYLIKHLERAIADAKKNDTQIALFFIDLDNFKPINDSFGHEEGDKVLLNLLKE